MTKVVVDTNVLVSALLKEQGAEATVLFAIADKKLTWCVSPAILAEYQTVLRRRKFSQIDDSLITALLTLAGKAEQSTPSFTVTESSDEPDNRFLECAEAAAADYLVTGNRRHFPSRRKGTQVVNARELLAVLEK